MSYLIKIIRSAISIQPVADKQFCDCSRCYGTGIDFVGPIEVCCEHCSGTGRVERVTTA